MSEEDRDDAMGRLGGPSKLKKLEEKVGRLTRHFTQRTDQLRDAIAVAAVSVGREINPTSAQVMWHAENGVASQPTGLFRIVGLGYDWCVIKSTTSDDIYFASTQGMDIRHDLGHGMPMPILPTSHFDDDLA